MTIFNNLSVHSYATALTNEAHLCIEHLALFTGPICISIMHSKLLHQAATSNIAHKIHSSGTARKNSEGTNREAHEGEPIAERGHALPLLLEPSAWT
jgi:hypothetical protein